MSLVLRRSVRHSLTDAQRVTCLSKLCNGSVPRCVQLRNEQSCKCSTSSTRTRTLIPFELEQRISWLRARYDVQTRRCTFCARAANAPYLSLSISSHSEMRVPRLPAQVSPKPRTACRLSCSWGAVTHNFVIHPVVVGDSIQRPHFSSALEPLRNEAQTSHILHYQSAHELSQEVGR